MPETNEIDQAQADWHAPEPEQKSSRWGGALSAAKGWGIKAREAATGAVTKGSEAVKNFDKNATLAAARAQVEKAAIAGKDLASRSVEAAGELKDKAREVLESERFELLSSTLIETLTSPEARKVLDGLPFAGGILKIIEAGAGSTMQRESLSGFDRLKRGFGGTKDLAVDSFGGEIIKGAKIGAALLEAGPDILAKIGAALQARQVKGADTLAALAQFMHDHPTITNVLTKRIAPKL